MLGFVTSWKVRKFWVYLLEVEETGSHAWKVMHFILSESRVPNKEACVCSTAALLWGQSVLVGYSQWHLAVWFKATRSRSTSMCKHSCTFLMQAWVKILCHRKPPIPMKTSKAARPRPGNAEFLQSACCLDISLEARVQPRWMRGIYSLTLWHEKPYANIKRLLFDVYRDG